MAPQSSSMALETLPSTGRVHIIGAGPVGLLLAALLQSMEGVSVHLYEKRREYTRTRMVQLAPYLVADSVESYSADNIDGDTVGAVFDPGELEEGLAFRQSIPPDLMTLLQEWAQGFCPLNTIERSLSELIDARDSTRVERRPAVETAEDAIAMLEPGDMLIDSTGSKSLLRDHLVPGADGGRGREHAQHPARVRARDHVPVRAGLRLQRVLQVLQERRERPVQVHPGGPSHLLRRQRHPRDRASSRSRPRTTRRCRHDSTGSGCAATFRTPPSRWTASSARSRRRPTARSSATSRSFGSR